MTWLPHRSRCPHHLQHQLLEWHFAARLRQADAVFATVLSQRFLELLEQLAVLLQGILGDRHLLAAVRFDIDEFQLTKQTRFGFEPVVQLDGV